MTRRPLPTARAVDDRRGRVAVGATMAGMSVAAVSRLELRGPCTLADLDAVPYDGQGW